MNAKVPVVHELSIALSIVDVATDHVRRQSENDIHVRAVHLKLGPLAGVVKASLWSAWELAREGSVLDGARLEIEDVPLVMHCPDCGGERPVVSIQDMCCRDCGAPAFDIVSGRELEVTAMEIDS